MRFIAKLTIVLAIVVFTSLFIYGSTFWPQSEYFKGYEGLATQIMLEVAKIRGLKPSENFQVKIVTSSWVKEHFVPPKVEEPLRWKVFKAIAFIPSWASFEEFSRKWAGKILAAAAGETLYIVEDMIEGADERLVKRTIAHESVHVLQYTNFQISYSNLQDSELAIKALVEGDADFTADFFLEQKGFKPFEEEGLKLQKMDYETALIVLQMFPYLYGEKFVSELWERGGWESINRAYENPPTSTEQVIHPEKYVRKEGFERPKPLVGEEWEYEGDDMLGEFFIRVYLARWLGEGIAKAASEGWEGDGAYYYVRGDDFLLVWAIKWEGVKDAREFYDAMLKLLTEAGASKLNDEWTLGGLFIKPSILKDKVMVISSSDREALKQY